MFDVQLFKERLRTERDKVGLTQADFATKVGIARANASYYENKKNSALPNVEVLYNMAKVLDVSYDYLMGESENTKRKNIDIGGRLGLTDDTIDKIEHLNMDIAGAYWLNLLFDSGLSHVILDLADLTQRYDTAKSIEMETYAKNPEQGTINSLRMGDISPVANDDGNPMPGLFSMYIGTDDFLELRLQQIRDTFCRVYKLAAEKHQNNKDTIRNKLKESCENDVASKDFSEVQ